MPSADGDGGRCQNCERRNWECVVKPIRRSTKKGGCNRATASQTSYDATFASTSRRRRKRLPRQRKSSGNNCSDRSYDITFMTIPEDGVCPDTAFPETGFSNGGHPQTASLVPSPQPLDFESEYPIELEIASTTQPLSPTSPGVFPPLQYSVCSCRCYLSIRGLRSKFTPPPSQSHNSLSISILE